MGTILMAGGGGGVDTSDVTATASDVLNGLVTVDSNGENIVGSMPDRGAVRPNKLNCGGSYTIPEGYHNGSGKVEVNTLASQTPVSSGKTAATAAMMLTGYQGWIDGKKITGSMTDKGAVTGTAARNGSYTIPAGYHNGSGKVTAPSATNKAATTITPNTKDQTVASGTYLTGILTVKGDANLVAANILSGKSIFGIAGSAKTKYAFVNHTRCDTVSHSTSKNFPYYSYSSWTESLRNLSETEWADYTCGFTYAQFTYVGSSHVLSDTSAYVTCTDTAWTRNQRAAIISGNVLTIPRGGSGTGYISVVGYY